MNLTLLAEPAWEQVRALLQEHERPVVLLEGTRALPDEDRARLIALAAMLARTFPRALFRTGNAPGSDEAFAEGVAQVDAGRLEYVLPYASHRAGMRQLGSCAVTVDAEDEALLVETLQATPHYAGLFDRRDARAQASRKYLLRDTLKVAGSQELHLERAVCGIFYVNAQDAMKGGTGHTLRVCQARQILVATQSCWMQWPA